MNMLVLQSGSSAIVLRAEDLVAQHPHFRGRTGQFDFECADGVLIVRGRVPTYYLKQLLQSTLQQLDDVCRLDCRVDVSP
jgi:hypothetical protein